MKKNFILQIFFFINFCGYAQQFKAPVLKDTTANSLKAKQIVEIPQSSRSARIIPVVLRSDTLVPVPVVDEFLLTSYQNMVYKHRLDSIQKQIPMEYNEYVQSYIDIYTSPRRKAAMAKIIGLAKYYFPIYEKAFKESGIPDDIKYLSIVESALDPNAVSRVGATGPWQFMFTTARLYGLKMDNYVDERKDPIQASYATARYLKDAYNDFGDWMLAIASYNCGKGNIVKAMQRSGGRDFWSIRNYLPLETRGYVPAFIAVTYVMNYYKKHQIIPLDCDFATSTDTVMVDKFVSLTNLSKALNMEPQEMAILNPSYKKRIINGSPASPKRLILPKTASVDFGNVYAALNNFGDENTAAVLIPVTQLETHLATTKPAYHRVRSGETLLEIADDYGIEVQDLKVWNHLKHNSIVPGQKLVIKRASEKEVSSPEKKFTKSYYTYKVKRGDTLNVIADHYNGVSVADIMEINNLKNNRLHVGMRLKINRG